MLKKQLNLLEDSVNAFLEDELGKRDLEETGTIISIDNGIALVKGLKSVKSQELIEFPGNTMGMAYNLDSESIGVILLGEYKSIESGDIVRRSFKVADIQ